MKDIAVQACQHIYSTAGININDVQIIITANSLQLMGTLIQTKNQSLAIDALKKSRRQETSAQNSYTKLLYWGSCICALTSTA